MASLPTPSIYRKIATFILSLGLVNMVILTLLAHEYLSDYWLVRDYNNNSSVLSVVRFNTILHGGPRFNLSKEFYQQKHLEWLHRFHIFHWLSLCPFLLSIPVCIGYMGFFLFRHSYLSLLAMCSIIPWKTNPTSFYFAFYLGLIFPP